MSKQIKNMLATLGTPKNQIKDSDGDGVSDFADCEPHNPNKQGLIHDVGKKVARKTLRGRFRHRAEKFIERKQKESEEVKKVKIEERQKQRLETAKVRETTRGERARTVIKKGGIVRKFTGGFSAPKGTQTTKVTTKPKYKFVKKGKHFVRKKVGTTKGKIQQKPKSSPVGRGESLQGFFDKRFPGGL